MFHVFVSDPIGNQYQIRFQLEEDTYAGIENGTDEIHPIVDDGLEDFHDKTSFIIREGLCSTPEYVYIESTLYPGKFWRHQEKVLKLHVKSDADPYPEDFCWRITKDKCNISLESVSFYAVNYQDEPLTKCGNQLKQALGGCGKRENVCWVLEKMIPGVKTTLRKKRKASTKSSDDKPPLVDVFLNPMMQMEKGLITEFMKNTTRHLFHPPLPPSSFPHLFHLLRRTNLPCFPSDQNLAHMILRYNGL